jgi:hypothetical protein
VDISRGGLDLALDVIGSFDDLTPEQCHRRSWSESLHRSGPAEPCAVSVIASGCEQVEWKSLTVAEQKKSISTSCVKLMLQYRCQSLHEWH